MQTLESATGQNFQTCCCSRLFIFEHLQSSCPWRHFPAVAFGFAISCWNISWQIPWKIPLRNLGKALCLETAGCKSFATCESDPKGCWMKDKQLSASSASSSNQHAIDTRGCKSWYKEENDPWTKRTLVANEGNHLASGDYTTIEGCNWLVLSDILLFSTFLFLRRFTQQTSSILMSSATFFQCFCMFCRNISCEIPWKIPLRQGPLSWDCWMQELCYLREWPKRLLDEGQAAVGLRYD